MTQAVCSKVKNGPFWPDFYWIIFEYSMFKFHGIIIGLALDYFPNSKHPPQTPRRRQDGSPHLQSILTRPG